MGRPVSTFTSYCQGENRHTNYALLMLKVLYDESPLLLAEVLGSSLATQFARATGVSFEQQVKQGNSTPDAIIRQEALEIHVEVKSYDWFYDDQMARHLESLGQKPGIKALVALSNFEDGYEERFERYTDMCAAQGSKVFFKALSFEDLLGSIQTLADNNELSKHLTSMITEYGDYLSSSGLLPNRRVMLDVVNCAGSIDMQHDDGVYMCPRTGGAYSHRKCRFFGAYKNKAVQFVADIQGVVLADGTATDEMDIAWTNGDQDTDLMKQRASDALLKHGWIPPLQVFVLGDRHETDFRKDSPKGMLGSKAYFDVTALEPADAEDLAEKLNGKKWTDF